MALIFANSADPDEMLHYEAFYLGVHCLPKLLFTGIQNGNGQAVVGTSDTNTEKKYLSQRRPYDVPLYRIDEVNR